MDLGPRRGSDRGGRVKGLLKKYLAEGRGKGKGPQILGSWNRIWEKDYPAHEKSEEEKWRPK